MDKTNCTLCQEAIEETGTFYKGLPAHINCYHIAMKDKTDIEQITWTDKDISEAWDSANGGDDFIDGQDYLKYMKENPGLRDQQAVKILDIELYDFLCEYADDKMNIHRKDFAKVSKAFASKFINNQS